MNIYIVRMNGGLANRMLQYAYSVYLREKGFEVFVDYTTSYKFVHEEIDWNKIFPNASLNQASKKMIFKFGGGTDVFDKIRRHYLSFTCRTWIMKDATDVPSDGDLEKNRYLIGVMQDSFIADSIKNQIHKTFSFNEFELGSSNAVLASKMRSENSVSVHLRKGKDYMENVGFQNTCTLEYYEKAIGLIKSRVVNPVFYVFTDNPDWVKENLKGFDYSLVTGNPVKGWGNHFDMQLMSCCKHNIIANSTYSWWGAFLNNNPEKIVIDPLFWFNPEIPEYRNRVNKTACEGWVLL